MAMKKGHNNNDDDDNGADDDDNNNNHDKVLINIYICVCVRVQSVYIYTHTYIEVLCSTLFYCHKTLPFMMLFACWVDVWLLNVGLWMDEHDKCARYISRGLRK